jgi:hypothetical protein
MKHILLFSLCSMCAGCFTKTERSTTSHSTDVIVVIDITDKKKLYPTAINSLLRLYDLKQFPADEAKFSVTSISDKTINPTYSCHLVSEKEGEKLNTQWDGQFRSRAIMAFYTHASATLNAFYKATDTSSSLTHSECWSTVASQLTELAQSSAAKKFLFVFSDLLERGDNFDSYKNISGVKTSSIASALLNIHSLPDSLFGIKCYVIYQPITREDDKKVSKMVQVYKSLIEARGGTVELKSITDNY